MPRISSQVLIVLILLNGAVGIADAAGLSQDLGTQFDTGVSESLDKAIDQAKTGFSPDSGAGETLFSLFVGAFFFVQGMFEAVFSAPTLFMNLGFPEWFVIPIFAPMYVIAALDFVYVAAGRGDLI